MPFKRFVQAYLLYGERQARIIERLRGFDLNCNEHDLEPIVEQTSAPLPPVLAEKFKSAIPLAPYTEEIDKQWLEANGLYEFYDFVMRRKQVLDETPPYFKWFNDCLWILAHREITCVVNIFMFNNETLESISDIITFKYRRKVGIEALERYRSIFWDTSAIDAKDALYSYIPFRDNALIVRVRSGVDTEIERWDSSSSDGSDTPIVFHDSQYIKWKLGYKKFDIPSPDDFLDQVKKDSYFKYYEAMNMIRSVEEEEESGRNDKLGDFDSKRKRFRNVEEQRVKAAKAWLDLYLRAEKSKRPDTPGDADIFEKMAGLNMEFDTEKLVSIDDHPEIMEEIRKDM